MPADASFTSLLSVSDVPVLFRISAGTQHGFSHDSIRMAGQDLCHRVESLPVLWRLGAGINIMGFSECYLSLPEDPALPTLAVETSEAPVRRGMLRGRLTTTTVRTPDGTSFRLLSGYASLLPWLPMPFIGCFLNDAGPAWLCDAGFFRNDFVTLLHETPLIHALGLRYVSPAARHYANSATMLALIEARQQQGVAGATAALDSVIADVTTKASANPFESLDSRQDVLLPRLAGMVAAIEREAVARPIGLGNAMQLFQLVKTLPPDAVAPYTARLDAVWMKDDHFAYGRSEPPDVAAIPARCKTEPQQAMAKAELWKSLSERRNQPVSDAELLQAYGDPTCHPADPFGNSVLGINRGATVRLDYANGRVVLFYTPGARARFEAWRNVYSSQWVPKQTCDSIGGFSMEFGPRKLCAPSIVAPLMAASLRR